MASKYPQELLSLIAHLKKLPGVGTRTAERFAFEFLTWDPQALSSLSNTLQTLHQNIPPCPTCGCLTDRGLCRFCQGRDTATLCIIASPRDAYAIEETHAYRGLYHVIEHLLSPLDNRHVHTLRLDRIQARIEANQIKEVIIALDSTLEGDTTALYLKNSLQNVSVSRLAFGIPIGSTLEYIDSTTLSRAFTGRQSI
jgi:recombination protein RecR